MVCLPVCRTFADRGVDNRSVSCLSVTETCASALAAARVMRAFIEITVARGPPSASPAPAPAPPAPSLTPSGGALARGAIRAGRAASFPPSHRRRVRPRTVFTPGWLLACLLWLDWVIGRVTASFAVTCYLRRGQQDYESQYIEICI